jgi:hypothetical protein
MNKGDYPGGKSKHFLLFSHLFTREQLSNTASKEILSNGTKHNLE